MKGSLLCLALAFLEIEYAARDDDYHDNSDYCNNSYFDEI